MTHTTAVATSSSVSQRVIELNNEAIATAMKGMRQNAVTTLQRALAMLLTLQNSKDLCNSPSRRNETVPLLAHSIPLLEAPSQDRCSKTLDDVFQFFSRAITIPVDDDVDYLNCPHFIARVQTTILYNLGVVCHMEAVCSGSSVLFGNALQFYSGAYQVLEGSSRTMGFPAESMLLLLLALFNNMGHIHSSALMNSDKTRQCVTWMQSTFAMPLVTRVLAAEEYLFFSQYICVPASQQLRISPAA